MRLVWFYNLATIVMECIFCILFALLATILHLFKKFYENNGPVTNQARLNLHSLEQFEVEKILHKFYPVLTACLV